MATEIAVQMTEQGLFVPRELFGDFGEIEIEIGRGTLVIRAKDLTKRFSGFVKSKLTVQEALDDYENSFLDGIDFSQRTGTADATG